MRKIITLLLSVILSTVVMSQAPQKISYQAVIRDAGNLLVSNQTVGTQISILQSTPTGVAVYIERHTPTTNTNGLISFEIGSGTTVAGSFTTIDWTAGPYFIKTETDPTGGTAYTISGTSQLLSVPYALHANSVENELDPIFGSSIAGGITATDTSNWNAHTVDTDTQIDSLGITLLGFVAGPHTIDTDTQIDSAGIAAFGYVAGPEIDGSITNEIQVLSISNDTIYLSNGGFAKLPPHQDTLPFPGSTLMNSMEQQKVNSWIGNIHQKWQKCYTKTTDGATSTIFHNQCDNKGPSVTVIKLANGRTLGGYTENSWHNTGNYRGYDKAFIFSIDSLQKHPLSGFHYSVSTYGGTSYGPSFGNGLDININSLMNLQYLNFPHAYSYNGLFNTPTDAACQALGGVNRNTAINIDEIEVWILMD